LKAENKSGKETESLEDLINSEDDHENDELDIQLLDNNNFLKIEEAKNISKSTKIISNYTKVILPLRLFRLSLNRIHNSRRIKIKITQSLS